MRAVAIRSAVFLLVVGLPLFPGPLGGYTPFAQLSAFRPQGILLIALLCVLAFNRKSLRLYAVLGLALAVIAALNTAPRLLSTPEPAASGRTTLTVMGANILGGGASPETVAALIRTHQPAFVSLPEATEDVRKAIEAKLPGYRGHTIQTDDSPVSATSVLVSTRLGDVRFDAAGDPTSFGHVAVTGGALGELRLIAYHSFPPVPSAAGRWRDDLKAIGPWCADGKAVIVGDFNASIDHAPFRKALGDRCRSVAPSVGRGLIGTWPADRPAFVRTQIDHVVFTEGLAPIGFTAYDLKGSDHRAVVAKLAV
ncbi:endonuclease/exonuclease/phosphatase family protein [Kribbella deserti]|uniref:Endonuclease/exonuclease/phosphatase family protein n=1 Tax=Kribbella deserti TaxID=1926257 RepID=A0ABV6QTA3_9ACTN